GAGIVEIDGLDRNGLRLGIGKIDARLVKYGGTGLQRGLPGCSGVSFHSSERGPKGEERQPARDQDVITSERQTEKSPGGFVAGNDALRRLEGGQDVADRRAGGGGRAGGRAFPEAPFDAGMIDAI